MPSVLVVQLYDTHAHVDDEAFDADRDGLLQRARDAGVAFVNAVGVTADSSERCLALAARESGVFAAVGIHPNYCAQCQPGDWDRIVALVDRPRVVALGETGLDRYWDHSPFALQQDFFDRHLQLAQARNKAFVVHMRECGPDVAAMLEEARRRGPLRGVMHSFAGDADLAARSLELGLYLSFAGMVTFKKADELRQIAVAVPEDRILVETDSPYLSPEPLRGKQPNEPARVVHTAACLAKLRGVSLEHFAERTTANARRLFGVE